MYAKENPCSEWSAIPSSLIKPDTWIARLGRSLRLSSIPTTWTEKLVSVSATHGSLSHVPSRNLHNMMTDIFCVVILLGAPAARLLCLLPTGSSLLNPYWSHPLSSYTDCWFDLPHSPPPFPYPICSRSISHHLTLFFTRITSSNLGRWRRHVPLKRRFIMNPHTTTTQKTAFFMIYITFL
jgi:hypothetical protein